MSLSNQELKDTNNKIPQPECLNIELMQHQKTMVYAMSDLEHKGYVDARFNYYDNEEKDLRISTNIGILGDKVGSGKTLDILTLLMTSPSPPNRPNYFLSDKYTTIREREKEHDGQKNQDKLKHINVIMVPKGIQHQWDTAITTFFKETPKYVNHFDVTTKDKLNDLTNESSNPAIIICNDKTITNVIDKFGSKKWDRFIIDEADTVQFNLIHKVNASFVWLVTGTTNGVPYSQKKYIKSIFGSNLTWLPDFLTLKNNNEYVDTSINLPKPNRITIRCFTPKEIRLLEGHIPKNVMNMINAGNTNEAIKSLNCHADTTDNIFKVISKNYEMAIANKVLELDAEKKKKYSNIEKNHEHLKRIKRLEALVEKLKQKLDSVKKSLYEVNSDMCPVCMDEFDNPTMVDCCAHKYCFNCLALTLVETRNTCPVCQTKITKARIHVLKNDNRSNDGTVKGDGTNVKNNGDTVKREKIEELYDIVKPKKDIDGKRNTDGKATNNRYLVFADYDETFRKIAAVLSGKKIKYGILKGSGKAVQKTLEDFKKGTINVILLNATNFGAGMNIQCATDIIMYHRFTREMEEQIIGRGQRIGRKGTLNVYYLIHDNENNSYVNENFNDMTYQEWVENDQKNDTIDQNLDVIDEKQKVDEQSPDVVDKKLDEIDNNLKVNLNNLSDDIEVNADTSKKIVKTHIKKDNIRDKKKEKIKVVRHL